MLCKTKQYDVYIYLEIENNGLIIFIIVSSWMLLTASFIVFLRSGRNSQILVFVDILILKARSFVHFEVGLKKSAIF